MARRVGRAALSALQVQAGDLCGVRRVRSAGEFRMARRPCRPQGV